jgi:hypothetical protein
LNKAHALQERIKKAGWEEKASEGSMIGGGDMEIETGGRSAQRPQYWTNQNLIEVEDIKNKGSIQDKDPNGMMTAPPHDYGPTGSTLHDHESGSDSTSSALKKSSDRILGSLGEGQNLLLKQVAQATESLANRLS